MSKSIEPDAQQNVTSVLGGVVHEQKPGVSDEPSPACLGSGRNNASGSFTSWRYTTNGVTCKRCLNR